VRLWWCLCHVAVAGARMSQALYLTGQGKSTHARTAATSEPATAHGRWQKPAPLEAGHLDTGATEGTRFVAGVIVVGGRRGWQVVARVGMPVRGMLAPELLETESEAQEDEACDRGEGAESELRRGHSQNTTHPRD